MNFSRLVLVMRITRDPWIADDAPSSTCAIVAPHAARDRALSNRVLRRERDNTRQLAAARIMCGMGSLDLAEELQKMYHSEINVRLGWLWDGGIDIWLGDDIGGFVAENVRSVAEILH